MREGGRREKAQPLKIHLRISVLARFDLDVQRQAQASAKAAAIFSNPFANSFCVITYSYAIKEAIFFCRGGRTPQRRSK